MKLATILCFAVACTLAGAQVVASVDAQTTDAVHLEKRYKDVVVNKDYQRLQELREKGSAEPKPTVKPWVRTLTDGKKEIVTPTVIAGVTFSAKPPLTTDGLEPWISLNKEGSPKTIKPKMKNGVIKNKSPDYGTWFQTVLYIEHTKEQLNADDMKDGEVFKEEVYVPEDLTYRQLNPILRCTPDFYKMKGVGKDISPEPFCFPHDNAVLYQDHTYFVTWYHRFFDDSVKNVRLHLSYVKESLRHKGTKRDTVIDRRSKVIQQGGVLDQQSFYVSEWIPKDEGMFALETNPDWLDGEFYKKVLITLQPDTVEDDDFDRMANYIVVELAQRAKVAKDQALDLKEQERKEEMKALYGDYYYETEEGIDYEKYLIVVTMPLCVLVSVVAMGLFVWYNSRDYDLSFLKNVKFNKKKSKKLSLKSKNKYSELPQWGGHKDD